MQVDPEALDALASVVPYVIQALGASHPVVQVLTLLGTVVGGVSALTKVITIVTKITPNTKDDVFASKLEKGVSHVVGVLDKIALNPTAEKARQEKPKVKVPIK